MKFGVYFAYWEQEWDVEFLKYVEKYKKLGLDVLEISGAGLMSMSDFQIAELKSKAEESNITITCGIGLPASLSTSSINEAVRQKGISYMKELFNRMDKLNSRKIGGTTHSYWPADYSKPIKKQEEWAQSVKSMKELAEYAASYDITILIESLNRFEQFLINDVSEAVAYIKEVDKPNVRILLDTFHMNIEEDNIPDAIRKAGKYLGHLHVGEGNRKVPGRGSLPWEGISAALHAVEYEGYVVMEPFVKQGGQIGSDIKVWRDLSDNADESRLDQDIVDAIQFLKNMGL